MQTSARAVLARFQLPDIAGVMRLFVFHYDDVSIQFTNYQRLIDGYLAGLPAARLARAQHYLGGNFDGPIRDIWA